MDLYKLGLDSTRLNAEGAAPVKKYLDELYAVADKKALAAHLGKLNLVGEGGFFGGGVDADLMDSKADFDNAISDVSKVADDHRKMELGNSIVCDQFTLTDAVMDDDGNVASGSYYIQITFLADSSEGGTWLSLGTALLDPGFEGYKAAAALQGEASLTGGGPVYPTYGGHYTESHSYNTSSSMETGSMVVSGELGAGSGVIDCMQPGYVSKDLANLSKTYSAAGAALGAYNFITTLNNWSHRSISNHDMYLEMKSFFYSSCYGKLTEGQKQLVQHAFDKFEKAYNTTKNTDLAITCTNSMITAAGIAATCSGAGAPVGLALSLGGTVVGYVSGCINEQVRKNFIKTYEDSYETIRKIIRAHAYQENDDDCKGDDDNPDGEGGSFAVYFDPSGIVYDGVIENPVKGAKATLYYAVDEGGNLLKEGEEGLVSRLVPASDVEGLNPAEPVQYTNDDGLYQWFTPEGLWFVKVEYAGMRGSSDADAEATVPVTGLAADGAPVTKLLPVLPEHMNVNIPVVDATAPEVTGTAATSDGLRVTFSKYMDESTVLDPNSYELTDSAGNAIPIAEVTPITQGHVPSNIDSSQPTFSRCVLVHAELPESGVAELTVKGTVKSYAGTAMGREYTGFAAAEYRNTLGENGEIAWEYRDSTGILTVTGREISESAPVWAATYEESGRMTAACPITASGGTAEIGRDFDLLKLFWLDENETPKCPAVEMRR